MLYSMSMTRSNRWILAVLAVGLLLAGATVAGRLWTKNITAKANGGKAQAEAGARSLAAMDATAAVSQFRAANESFASVSRALGPDWVSRTAESIPWAGRQYAAARSLARIGSDGSLAAIELTEALREAPTTTATVGPAGQLGAQLSSRLAHVDVAFASLSDTRETCGRTVCRRSRPPIGRRSAIHPGRPA